MTVFNFPKFEADVNNIKHILKLGQQILNATDSVIEFRFRNCTWIMPYGVAYLGGISRLLLRRGVKVNFDWSSVPENVRDQMLARNGFMEAFGDTNNLSSRTAVPYREDIALDKSQLMDYLTNQWIGRGWVHVSNKLRDAIAGQMYEIYDNAFTHANSPIGVISVGQYYPRMQQLLLTVADFGVGIPENVRRYFDTPQIEADKAIRWSFKKGNSTKAKDGVSRGLGFDLLKSFVSINKGKMTVFSGNALATISESEETYIKHDALMPGTLINITLQCDENRYVLSSDDEFTDDVPWF